MIEDVRFIGDFANKLGKIAAKAINESLDWEAMDSAIQDYLLGIINNCMEGMTPYAFSQEEEGLTLSFHIVDDDNVFSYEGNSLWSVIEEAVDSRLDLPDRPSSPDAILFINELQSHVDRAKALYEEHHGTPFPTEPKP